MTKKNIFIIGFDEFNRKKLENLPQAEECNFHAALDVSDIRNVASFDIKALVDKAIRAMETVAASGQSIDGVATFYDFPGTDLVPILAGHFNLPGPSLESILKCENKYWSRLEQHKVIAEHIPQFQPFDPFDKQAFSKIDILPPFWIKPMKAFKSFLSYQINSEAQFDEAAKEMRKHIGYIGEPFKYLMENYGDIPEEIVQMPETCIAESPIGGFQCTLEGYSYNGNVVGYGIVDSIREQASSSFARYQYPSALPIEIQHRMINIARSAILQVGLDNAPFNIEFFYDQTSGNIYLLEINPRISQAHTDMFEKVHGLSHHHIMTELALGRKPAVMEKKGKYNIAGHFMVRTQEEGTVLQAPSQAEKSRVKERFPDTEMKILVKEGERLAELSAVQDSYSYEIANIFIGARDESEMLEKYQETMEILTFRIEREKPVLEL